jgi:hypothetical protein
MTIRLMGQPAEVDQAVIIVVYDAKVSGVIRIGGMYPNRGGSRQVRSCIEAQLRPASGAAP